jgi:hypothetical protein
VKINKTNYKTDRYYFKVKSYVDEHLKSADSFTVPEVLIGVGMLSRQDFKAWQEGRVDYLEKVLKVDLSKLGRMLRVIDCYAKDLGLHDSHIVWQGKGKKKKSLKFTKTGAEAVERAYHKQYVKGDSSLEEDENI